jgi:hypothetical protein
MADADRTRQRPRTEASESREPMKARRVPHAELELIQGPVTADGGELRQLSGSDYGLVTSVMHPTV